MMRAILWSRSLHSVIVQQLEQPRNFLTISLFHLQEAVNMSMLW
jgi:hypothetical protein